TNRRRAPTRLAAWSHYPSPRYWSRTPLKTLTADPSARNAEAGGPFRQGANRSPGLGPPDGPYPDENESGSPDVAEGPGLDVTRDRGAGKHTKGGGGYEGQRGRKEHREQARSRAGGEEQGCELSLVPQLGQEHGAEHGGEKPEVHLGSSSASRRR